MNIPAAETILPEILATDIGITDWELIAANVALLLSDRIKALVEETGSYEQALFGAAEEVKPPENQGFIDQKEVLEDLGVYEACYFQHEKGGIFNFKTITGYNEKAHEPQARGYKHYLSLDLSSAEKLTQGTRLYRALAEGAIECDAPFASKHWTAHSYDAQIIYTVGLEDTATVARLLHDIYPSYEGTGLLLATPRLFQGQVTGIDPNYVTWVREDLPDMPDYESGLRMSHSMRMQKLGRIIDGLSPDSLGDTARHIDEVSSNLTPDFFAASALASWMNPARPYLTVCP